MDAQAEGATPGGAPANNRLLTGPVGREMLRFGAPIAIGMGLQTTFNLVDAYVIARLDPSVAGPSLGALGICDQLSAIGTIVSYGITTASTALIAQAYGRGDHARVKRIVWQSILAVTALSLLFGLTSLLFAGPILAGVVGAKGAVAELGTAYLRVNSGGAFTMFFLLQLTAVQRALGSSKTPVALLVLSNVLNLFLAVLLVYGPGDAPPVFSWGPPIARLFHLPRLELLGAAWATVLARAITLVAVVVILFRRFDAIESRGKRSPDRATLTEILKVAWPSSTQFVVRMIAMLVTHGLVARAFTTATDQSATTALGIVFRLETMALFVAMGWGSAAQTFVGQNLGAKRVARATRAGIMAAVFNAVLMLAIAIAYQKQGRAIVEFFDADPRVVDVGLSYLRVVSWAYLGLGTGVVLGSAITGAGATRLTLVVDLAVVLLFQLPACSLAALLAGASLDRLWIAVAGTYALSGLVYVGVYVKSGWARRFLPRIAPEKDPRTSSPGWS